MSTIAQNLGALMHPTPKSLSCIQCHTRPRTASSYFCSDCQQALRRAPTAGRN